MTRYTKSLLLFAGAWVLWERVLMTGQPEQWNPLGAAPSQSACLADSQYMAEKLSKIMRGDRFGASTSFQVYLGNGVRRLHLIECYPSDFNPRR